MQKSLNERISSSSLLMQAEVKGDLRITPKQQIEFLVKLHTNKLPFSPPNLSEKGILYKCLCLCKDVILAVLSDSYQFFERANDEILYGPWMVLM